MIWWYQGSSTYFYTFSPRLKFFVRWFLKNFCVCFLTHVTICCINQDRDSQRANPNCCAANDQVNTLAYSSQMTVEKLFASLTTHRKTLIWYILLPCGGNHNVISINQTSKKVNGIIDSMALELLDILNILASVDWMLVLVLHKSEPDNVRSMTDLQRCCSSLNWLHWMSEDASSPAQHALLHTSDWLATAGKFPSPTQLMRSEGGSGELLEQRATEENPQNIVELMNHAFFPIF